MPSGRCSHHLSPNKRTQRIDAVVAFAKTATPEQLSARLVDVWQHEHSSISEARLLLILAADPAPLYDEEFGHKTLEQRRLGSSLCQVCAALFSDFLDRATGIYSEMLGDHDRKCSSSECSSNDSGVGAGRMAGGSRAGPKAGGSVVLCLDGGGVRGLVSVLSLLFASRRIFGDESLPECFDWLVGTSTGSMLSLALAKGMSLKETFFLYWELRTQIFLDGSTMSRLLGKQVEQQSRNFDDALNLLFPSETLKEARKRITVPALDISTTPASLHIFRNYIVDPAQDAEEEDVPFKDVARASSAAPTYFHPHTWKGARLVDGSLVANCPLNVFFMEVDSLSRHGRRPNVLAVLSVGTGEPERTERKYASGSTLRKKARSIAHLSTLILEQAVGHDQSIVNMSRQRCLAHSIPFFRLSPSGINVRIDQVDSEKLLSMLWTSLLWLVDNVQEIDGLGDALHKLQQASVPEDGLKRRSHSIL